MEIVHIASEFAPFAKVGGLGDVVHGLSKAQAALGHRVRVILPKYNHVEFPESPYEGVHLQLIDSKEGFFSRGAIYGEEDDVDRFLYFCLKAVGETQASQVDALHLHDWPAAGCSLLLREQPRPKMVITIHNLAYQGVCAKHHLEQFAIPFDEMEVSDPTAGEGVNLLKAAFLYSDTITAVSPTYAEEILTPQEGCGLEGVLEKEKDKLSGILNGIDMETWDPLYTFETYKEGKQSAKKELGLALDKPLVISVTRLVPQKGPDLILYGIEQTLALGGQFFLLGSAGDKEILEPFEELTHESHFTFESGFDESLSHKLYAAADMLLMPSIFEPCGLSQMIALRHGTVPLVRATGGLKDTVFEGENGFVFQTPDNKGVKDMLERAFEAFGTEAWDQLVQSGMESDLSWSASAKKYLKLYE